jgi:hypothetical protein
VEKVLRQQHYPHCNVVSTQRISAYKAAGFTAVLQVWIGHRPVVWISDADLGK